MESQLYRGVVGDWGAVVKTQDGGLSWQDVSLPEDVVIYGVTHSDSGKVFLSGEYGMVFSTEDNGATWQSQTPGMGKTLFSITRDGGTLFAGGMEGMIVYSDDSGITWKPSQKAARESIYGIRVKGDKGWAVGDLGTLLLTSDRGRTWQKKEMPMQFKLLWFCAVDMMNTGEPSGFIAGARGLFLQMENGQISK